MAKVKFLATTITSKGRFEAGQEADFPADEAKELQRLTSVESATVKKAPKSREKKDGDK